MTRCLPDTHVLLWALAAPENLHPSVASMIEDPANDILFSAASIWEIAIKAGLGRSDFAAKPKDVAREVIVAGFKKRCSALLQ